MTNGPRLRTPRRVALTVVALIVSLGRAEADPIVLKTSARLWPPGATIRVLIENPGIVGNPILNATFQSTVQAQFETWERYQADEWGSNGLKFVFITAPGETPDITVKWVDSLAPDSQGNVRLGVADIEAKKDGKVVSDKGRTTIDNYKNTKVTITLAKKTPGTGNFRPADALAQTAQHEIGHAEGLSHQGGGAMIPHTTVGESLRRPVDLSTDVVTKAIKSSIQGAKTPLSQPGLDTPIGNLIPPPGPTMIRRPDNSHEVDLTPRSDPFGGDVFRQIGLLLNGPPGEVIAPDGWRFAYVPSEIDADFVVNGELFDESGAGWLHFFAVDSATGLHPGEALTLRFVTPAGVSPLVDLIYGLTARGDAQFVAVAEPPLLVLLMTAMLASTTFALAVRRMARVEH
jgi:hypothetical protein